jgi:hypothetical protein
MRHASKENLQTVTLISLFFSFSGDRGFKDSILYNFSHTGAWKRLTVYSDFYGLSGGREYFAVEVNADHVLGSVETAEHDFRRHTSEKGLFAGDLRLEGSNTLSNAYPVYTDKADEQAANAIAALRKLGIESFGRQGGFDYHTNGPCHYPARRGRACPQLRVLEACPVMGRAAVRRRQRRV